MTNMQELLCNEFCGALSVSKVPAGFAIGTGYDGPDGDPIGFYVIGPNQDGKFRIEDDGLSIPVLETKGVDLSAKTRSEAFESLLKEYEVFFDDESGELTTEPLAESQVASSALRFVAFLLRVQDLLLMSRERVASTFKEDAIQILRKQVGDNARIEEDYIIHQALKDCPADLAIFAENRDPVALFFGFSDQHIYEALLLQSYAENKHVPCSVAVLLETETSASQKMRQRANNHLDAVPIFRGAEEEACARIVRQATGINPMLH